jgi:CheY-like chemotaxis protein
MIRLYLEQHGVDVIDAASGEEALELFQREHSGISIVLTDHVMPGMSGRELAGRIHSSNSEIPVLLMSGYLTEPTVEPDGMRCLPKPLDLKSLVATLTHLGRHLPVLTGKAGAGYSGSER